MGWPGGRNPCLPHPVPPPEHPSARMGGRRRAHKQRGLTTMPFSLIFTPTRSWPPPCLRARIGRVAGRDGGSRAARLAPAGRAGRRASAGRGPPRAGAQPHRRWWARSCMARCVEGRPSPGQGFGPAHSRVSALLARCPAGRSTVFFFSPAAPLSDRLALLVNTGTLGPQPAAWEQAPRRASRDPHGAACGAHHLSLAPSPAHCAHRLA